MNATKTYLLSACLAFALLPWASNSLQAQDTSFSRKLFFQLNATVQSDVTAGTTSHTRLVNKDLLNLVANAAGLSLAPGTCLGILDNQVKLCDKSGTPRLDLSGYFTVTPSTTNVWASVPRYSSITVSVVQISFNDGQGNAFTLSAMTKDTYRFHLTDGVGDGIKTESTVATCMGTGTLGGKTAIFSGTISSSGSALYFNPANSGGVGVSRP